MRLFGKDLSKELAIIAEIGVNHEGSVEAASKLVSLAAETGADAVKFQTFTPARYASATDPARLERVTGFALDEAAHRRLAGCSNPLCRGAPAVGRASEHDRQVRRHEPLTELLRCERSYRDAWNHRRDQRTCMRSTSSAPLSGRDGARREQRADEPKHLRTLLILSHATYMYTLCLT